jgi:ABC-2 type transport system ATP-binding protein
VTGLAIETRELCKWFGATLAVADLSLSVRTGEIFGFLGPNGAGKTTSVKMLLSLVTPDGGAGRVLGQRLGDRETRGRIGFLPEHFRFHDCLTARELLRFHGRLYGLSGSDLDMRIDRLLARVDLLEAADRPVRGYSKGMLQRTGLAQALLNDPSSSSTSRLPVSIPWDGCSSATSSRSCANAGRQSFSTPICSVKLRPRATEWRSSNKGGSSMR